MPTHLPPAGLAVLKQMVDARHSGDLARARTLAQTLAEQFPHNPTALGNHAALLEATTGDAADVEALYWRAHALDPDYRFARCGLARCLVRTGDADTARELIRPLLSRERLHVGEYRALLQAQLAVAEAEAGDDHATITGLQQVLKQLDEQFGD